MSNVKKIIGGIPEGPKRIADMKEGESGYTAPWAYQDGWLQTDFEISKRKGGTATLRVECVGDREYVIEFEKPVWEE